VLVVDTGPLVATADRGDKDHAACRALLEGDEGPLVTTAMVIAEAAYLIDRQLGATRIATLNHRHFTVVRPRHADAFELLP
jgi:predicted nucleic acid-binding protein